MLADKVLMIDIETLSLSVRAHVTQVGFCIYGFRTRDYLVRPTNRWMSASWQEDRRRDFDTIKWWMQQDRKVAQGVFNAPDTPTGPWDLFAEFESLVKEHDPDVYGDPAMFDLPILTDMWSGRKPWKYNREMCAHTVQHWIDPERRLAPEQNAMAHDAAADAHWQMEYLIRLRDRWARIEGFYIPGSGK